MRRDPLVTLPAALTARAPERKARYVMGVDGGATKTLAAVLDLGADGGAGDDAGAVHLGHGGSSNADAVGARTATDSILKATDEAIARAGASPDDLDAAVLAIAGTDTDSVARHMRTVRPGSWVVVNDVVGAWAAATGGEPGVGVISGTGSNVFGVGRSGGQTRAWRAGGWGHVLGDQGSGYWIAARSLTAALADRDGSGPTTALSDAAVEFFGVPSVEALAALVYSKPLSKGEIAAFAIETARLAHAGDAVAVAIYERAAADLAAQAAAVIEQTGLGGGGEGTGDLGGGGRGTGHHGGGGPGTGGPDGEGGGPGGSGGTTGSDSGGSGGFPVGLIGSAFKAGSVFVDPLSAAVRGAAPGARVAVVEMAPVGGCLLLAARTAGAASQVDQVRLKALLDATLARESVFRE